MKSTNLTACIYGSAMDLRITLGALAVLVSACGSEPVAPEPPSDPTDYFFHEEWMDTVTAPPLRFHEQNPRRLFETSLRPTDMQASLPTSYLSRVTRNYRPWANEIYDVAYLSFDRSTFAPLSPEEGTGWGLPGENGSHDVLIEFGGWNAKKLTVPETHIDPFGGEVQRRGELTVITRDNTPSELRYFFEAEDKSDLNGNPAVAECHANWKCTADLVFPQEYAGLEPLYVVRDSIKPYKGTTGAKLRITFHPDALPEWAEIRRKAVCLAALSVQDINLSQIAPKGRLNCDDVRKEIFERLDG